MIPSKFKKGDKIVLVLPYATSDCKVVVGDIGRVKSVLRFDNRWFVCVKYARRSTDLITNEFKLRHASVANSEEFNEQNKQKERL